MSKQNEFGVRLAIPKIKDSTIAEEYDIENDFLKSQKFSQFKRFLKIYWNNN